LPRPRTITADTKPTAGSARILVLPDYQIEYHLMITSFSEMRG